MSNKQKKKKSVSSKQQDSVFKEAWGNMNDDMARVMPDFIAKRLRKKEGKLWLMVVVTLVELIVLGVVGKFLYDWLTG